MSENRDHQRQDDGRESVVRVRGLETRFGADVVHRGLDLDLYRGEILGIVGGSGSGKSVLMRCILGLLRPQGGRIEVFGRDVLSDPSARRGLEHRAGVLFQDGALFSSLNVLENVEVPFKAHAGHLDAKRRERLARLQIALVGLPGEAASKLPAELSGGMRKRAGLARALALNPELLFLDEPTAGLDPISAADFDHLLKTLKEALGLTVFLITHDLDTLYAICDRVAVLSEGKVLTAGPLEEIETFDDQWVHNYFHGPRARAAHAAAARTREAGQQI